MRFEVPAGGAVIMYEGGGDGRIEALDGVIELVGANGWRIKFDHVR